MAKLAQVQEKSAALHTERACFRLRPPYNFPANATKTSRAPDLPP